MASTINGKHVGKAALYQSTGSFEVELQTMHSLTQAGQPGQLVVNKTHATKGVACNKGCGMQQRVWHAMTSNEVAVHDSIHEGDWQF